MSYKATAWAYDLELPSPRKFVLVALADFADEEGTCFPSQERLAKMTGLGESTVRRALTDLESEHLLSKQPRFKDGHRTSNRYRLAIGRQPLAESGSNRSLTPVIPLAQSVTTARSGRVTTNEPPEEPSLLLNPDGSSVNAPSKFEEFWKIYPRREGKVAARKAFEKAAKTTPVEDILTGVRRFASDPNLPEKQYIAHPSTWLNRGSWDDEALPQRTDRPAPAAAAGAGDWWKA